MPLPPPRTLDRLLWIDRIRGAAILLMMLLHATLIPSIYGTFTPTESLVWFNTVLTPLRMPILMFLSGMLLPRSLAKPLPRFFIGKFQVLAWAYLLWAFVYLLILGRIDELVTPWTWVQTIYLWYISFLLVYYLAAPLTKYLPTPLTLSLAACSYLFCIHTEHGFIQKFFFYWFFFLLGDLYVRKGYEARLSTRMMRFTTGAAGVITLTLASLDISPDHPLGAALWRLVSSAILVSAVLAFTPVLLGWKHRDPIQRVGRDSLVYYTSHYPVMILISRAATTLGITNSTIVTLLCLIAALAIGKILATSQKYSIIIRSLFLFPTSSR